MTFSTGTARATPVPSSTARTPIPSSISRTPIPTSDPSSGLSQARGIRHVLVCLDRSGLAEGCLPHARFVADAFGARLTLLDVLATPDGDQPSNRPDALEWELARREAQRYLSDTQAKLDNQGFSADRVSIEVTQGRPAERIVTLAREIRADLTVLSSHGEGAVGAWNLGNTTQQVVALAPGSVLVVPPDFGAGRNVPPKRILVAVDGSLRTQSVLPEVAQLARFHSAEILLVHIVAEPKPTAVLSSEDDLQLARSLASRLQGAAEKYLAQLRERLFAEVAVVETLVLRELNKRRALLDVASRADLLVLAAHGATCDASRPFGSVASYALANAKLPLLVLQDLTAPERESYRPQGPASEDSLRIRASFAPRSPEAT